MSDKAVDYFYAIYVNQLITGTVLLFVVDMICNGSIRSYSLYFFQERITIKERIPAFLDDEKARIVTTPCIILEVEKLGKLSKLLAIFYIHI